MGSRLSPRHRRQLLALRRAYARDVPKKLEALREAGALLLRGGGEREALEEVFVLAHRLSGSAGIFGFEALRQKALALEELLVELKERPLPRAAWEGRLLPLLGGLGDALPAPLRGRGAKSARTRPKARPHPRGRSARH